MLTMTRLRIFVLLVMFLGSIGFAMANLILLHVGNTPPAPSGGGAPVCLPMSVCPGGLM